MNNNDLQSFINLVCENEKLKRERDNYNLGNLIEDLKKYPKDAIIFIDPFDLYPVGFDSYRGYYTDLCIEYVADRYSNDVLNCGELLKNAEECIGKTFAGYKGGDFIMDKNSVIWLSNYGQVSNVMLTGVKARFGNGKYLNLTWKVVED